MVQNILSAMDSDEVNTINDTKEASQVAETIKEVYYEMFGNHEIAEKKSVISLDGLGDLTRPNYMKVPDNVLHIDWIKYKDGDEFKSLYFCPPEEFLERVLRNKDTTTTASTIDPDGALSYYVKNNQAPTYYTSFDDDHIVFDSYKATEDDTLQSSRSITWGNIDASWSNADGFIPDLDANLFPLLLAESKSVCFSHIKQAPSAKAEQQSRRQRIKLQYTRHKSKKQEKSLRTEGNNYARSR